VQSVAHCRIPPRVVSCLHCRVFREQHWHHQAYIARVRERYHRDAELLASISTNYYVHSTSTNRYLVPATSERLVRVARSTSTMDILAPWDHSTSYRDVSHFKILIHSEEY
jgi:hypothetical protein